MDEDEVVDPWMFFFFVYAVIYVIANILCVVWSFFPLWSYKSIFFFKVIVNVWREEKFVRKEKNCVCSKIIKFGLDHATEAIQLKQNFGKNDETIQSLKLNQNRWKIPKT